MLLRLIVCCLIFSNFSKTLAQTSKNDVKKACDWYSKTPPSALSGNEGSSNTRDYWFAHLADVDTESSKHRFIYQIKNQHASKLLPVEWLQGDGSTQIGFSRIPPGGCATNDFESHYSFREDSQARIRYGPIRQEVKIASLYVLDRIDARRDGPPLRSRIIAEVEDAKKNSHRLSIEVTTEYKEGTFVHRIKNFGSQGETVRIPALLALRETNTALMAIIQWPMERDLLFLPNNERAQSFSFSVSENTSVQEAIVPIEVVSFSFDTRESETIARANITLYLPITDN